MGVGRALVWSTGDETRISWKARALIESFQTEVYVSAASAWEIATKVRIGKLPGAEVNLARLGFLELGITVDHGQRAGGLPEPHRDPFDRMLIAQAQNMPDDQYGYRVPRIW